MFPNDDEFIDPPTIIVLLAKNLVPTLLEANTTSPYKTWKEKMSSPMLCPIVLLLTSVSRTSERSLGGVFEESEVVSKFWLLSPPIPRFGIFLHGI